MAAAVQMNDPAATRSIEILRKLFGERLGRDIAARTWDGQSVDAAGARFTMIVCEPWALRAAFTPPLDVNPGRAFALGWIDVEGDLEAAIDALEHATDGRSRLEMATLGASLARLPSAPRVAGEREAKLGGKRHSRTRDAAAIGFHYDQPAEFYRLLLGESFVYSCAYYADGITNVDDAQRAKLDLVLDKVRLRPGQTFLDIGCGWGSLVMRAAERGAIAHGITLSTKQYEVAQRRIADAGLGDRATVELRDYRELGERQFDAIASIGMVEHVGREQYPEYFTAAYNALRPGGLFLNHGITMQTRDGKGYRAAGDFIGRYVFPDGDLAPLDVSTRAAEAVGFEVRDVENLREHYARTLRAWGDHLASRRAEAVALTDAQTERIWRIYMAGSARNFAIGRMGLQQTLLGKPRADGTTDIPATRADIYAAR